MPIGYALPDPLPWAALAASLAAAEDLLARLDERLRGSPIREGWIARTHFADSCASLWLDGDLVPLEDLVLHDAHRDIHAPTRALIQAQAVLRARRRIAAADPGWALTPAGLAILRGRAGEGDPDTEPAPRDDAPGLDHEPAGGGLFTPGSSAEEGPEGCSRTPSPPSKPPLAAPRRGWPATRRGKKPAIRWSTISTGTRRTAWPTGGPPSRRPQPCRRLSPPPSRSMPGSRSRRCSIVPGSGAC